ncbi:ABC transporter ATP-binding protein [Achromobacter insuavis]
MIAPFASIPAATGETRRAAAGGGSVASRPLPAGALTVVLGTAASGKTRLLSRIARDLADADVATRVIMVERHAAAVPSLRVFEALLLAHKQGDRWAVGTREIQAVRACLLQVGLAQAADGLVEQLDAEARQRLLIAHALIRQPDALLMDGRANAGATPSGRHRADAAAHRRRTRVARRRRPGGRRHRVASGRQIAADARRASCGHRIAGAVAGLARAGDIDAAWLPS